MPSGKSGITYSQSYHWRCAARWRGYKWQEFIELDGDEQSEVIAEYETHNQIEGVVIEANKQDGK